MTDRTTDIVICTGDHEYSIFESVEDHRSYGPEPDCELHRGTIMVSLDGWRGHYLGRDFIYEALGLLDIEGSDDEAICDRYEDEYDKPVEEGSSYTVAECVFDMVGEYETRLFDRGYLVEWNDGAQVVKIEDAIPDLVPGDKVYRLNRNEKPMLASNGAYKIQGNVTSVSPGLVRVRWITRGAADPSETYDPPENLRRVDQ